MLTALYSLVLGGGGVDSVVLTCTWCLVVLTALYSLVLGGGHVDSVAGSSAGRRRLTSSGSTSSLRQCLVCVPASSDQGQRLCQ